MATDLNRKLVVNGSECASMDEGSDDILDAVQTAGSRRNLRVITDSPVLDGKEYGSKSGMPSRERATCEQVMKSAAADISQEELDGLGALLAASAETPSGRGAKLSSSLTPFLVVLSAFIAAIALYFYIF